MISIFPQNLIDSKLYALLGEKTAADNEKPVKKKKEKPVKVEVSAYYYILIQLKKHNAFVFLIYKFLQVKSTPEEAPQLTPSEEEVNPYLIFPSPEENYKVTFMID